MSRFSMTVFIITLALSDIFNRIYSPRRDEAHEEKKDIRIIFFVSLVRFAAPTSSPSRYNMPFNDLREFIDAARRLGQLKEIHGADWNLEIGALTEMFALKEPSPMVLFDQIPGYPNNFRVVSNIVSNPTRSGLTVGMAAD